MLRLPQVIYELLPIMHMWRNDIVPFPMSDRDFEMLSH